MTFSDNMLLFCELANNYVMCENDEVILVSRGSICYQDFEHCGPVERPRHHHVEELRVAFLVADALELLVHRNHFLHSHFCAQMLRQNIVHKLVVGHLLPRKTPVNVWRR